MKWLWQDRGERWHSPPSLGFALTLRFVHVLRVPDERAARAVFHHRRDVIRPTQA
jgi:hypothetical protein